MRTALFAFTFGAAIAATPLAGQTPPTKPHGGIAFGTTPAAAPHSVATPHPAVAAWSAPAPHPAPTPHPAPAPNARTAAHPVPPTRPAPAAEGELRMPTGLVPEAWAPQDPADSLYRAAREALNRNNYDRAASLFAEIVRRFPQSQYAPDAYYWQAFALYRKGGAEDLRAALEILERQKSLHPKAATIAENEALATRIRGQLARLGDARAAESLTKAATASTTSCNAEEDAVRAAALNALLQMDAERAVPILEQVLARRDECFAPLRRKAVFLLSQKVTPQTADMLLDLAQNDPDPEVREQAVFWLSQVRSEKAVDALAHILRTSNDPAIQEKAIFALSQHRSTRAAALLREYVIREDAPARLREQAIFWIGQSQSSENARFLRELFARTADPRLKEKILFSLSQMRGQGNDRWLLEVALDTSLSIDLRKSAIFWAGQAGVPFDALAALYDRVPDRELKEQLIFVFSQRRDSAALDKLIEIARKDPDRQLREKAIFWIGQSKDPRAAEFLLEVITNG